MSVTLETIHLDSAFTGTQLADLVETVCKDRYVEFIGDDEYPGRQGEDSFVIGITPQTPEHYGFLVYLEPGRNIIHPDGAYTQFTLVPVFTRPQFVACHRVIEEAKQESLLLAVDLENAARNLVQTSA